MKNGLFALLWLNLHVRWREWRAGDADGLFLQQMRAMGAADVIWPRSSRNLRLVRSNPQSARRRSDASPDFGRGCLQKRA